LRDSDTLARLGGDEFAVLLEDLKDRADADVAADRVIDALTSPIVLDQATVIVGASVGVTGGLDGESAEALLRNADMAMYVAKSRQKGSQMRFHPDMQSKVLERLELEADLRRAVQEHQFVLQYQPIVGLSEGELASVEALVRWNHPRRGRLQPGSFIAVAEETGLIVAMGRWALREATRQAREWERDSGRKLRVGVNISMRHLTDPSLIDDVQSALNESGLAPHQLLIEITESVLMSDSAEVLPVLAALKRLGVRIALDDFGTGYSSLAYLQDMPIDVLKIDKSFVDKLGGAQPDQVLVKAIVNLGATLMLRVVAEGIETPQQVEQLQALGCDLGQGYYFDRAVDADRVLDYLNGHIELSTVTPREVVV
jgi:predicted signal transduction protein with EAL and GGDEF domain